MKTSIILCEGESDRDLLGCYLEKVSDLSFIKYRKDNPFPGEPISWFANESGCSIGIWHVGGNDFCAAVKKIIEREKKEHQISYLAVVTDHDDQDAENNRLQGIISLFENWEGEFIINQWNPVSIENAFSKTEIQFLYLLIPVDEYGALETFMLYSLAESSAEKKEVIEQSRIFIKDFKSSCYLQKRREKKKAELGVSLAIFNPDRSFSTMKELIDSVDWKSCTTANRQFQQLNQLFSK